jgi:hypothetical protein
MKHVPDYATPCRTWPLYKRLLIVGVSLMALGLLMMIVAIRFFTHAPTAYEVVQLLGIPCLYAFLPTGAVGFGLTVAGLVNYCGDDTLA